MLRKALILMTGILLITTLQASAMMGGHGSGGDCTSGQNTMQGQGGHMMGNGTYNDMYHGDYNDMHHNDMQSMPQSGRMVMDRYAAESMIERHMQNQNIGSWHFGPGSDNDSYYIADILGPNNEVIDRVFVDKRTGNLRSLGGR